MDAIDKYPKSSRLHLIFAYISHEKLKNKFKALYEMMIIEEQKASFQEEFSIYRYKNQIEEEMLEDEVKVSGERGIDVN